MSFPPNKRFKNDRELPGWTPRYMQKPKPLAWSPTGFFGKLFLGGIMAVFFGIVALLLLLPFIWSGTVIYVFVHFARKLW